MIEAFYQSIIQHPLFAALFTAFLSVLLIQLIYFWGLFSRFAFGKRKNISERKPSVSIVIYANNQYTDLRLNLPEFLNLDYPDYEVIVVNDCSEDDSEELLERFAEQYSHLKTIEMKQSLNWFKGQKFPLSIGIKSAKNDILLLTDIRCRPVSNRWISEMVESYGDQTEIVIGYTAFRTPSKINIWIRFTAFYEALFYFSMGMARNAFKGVGTNLSYRKSLFYQQQGLISHYAINAGDDELFVNQAATRSNVSVQFSPESIMEYTKPLSFLQWLAGANEKLSLRRHFKFRHRFLLSVYNSSLFVFYALFGYLLILNLHWALVLGFFLLRLISQMIIFGFAQKKLSEKRLLLLSPFFEIFLMLNDLLIWFGHLFTKKKKWR